MKILLLIPVFIVSILQSAQAQNDSVTPQKIYKIWIKTYEVPQKMKGVLFEIKDSSVMVSNSLKKKDYYQGKFDVSKLDVRTMDVIKIRRMRNINRAAVIGTFSGFALGGIIGYFITKPSSGSFNPLGTLWVSTLGAGLGAIVGSIIGSVKIKIPIKGSQKQFDGYKSKMNEYAIKNNPTIEEISIFSFSKLRDTLVDIDGNVYHTVTRGKQVWMSENLKVTHYRNGEAIPNITGDDDWSRITTGAYCNYGNDTNNARANGRLYNWYAVRDSNKLCPAGWHVPSFSEWTSLINSLGSASMVESKMNKEALAGSFFVLLGKTRDQEGKFPVQDQSSQWWTATEQDPATAQGVNLNYKAKGINVQSYYKLHGFSVRCIRDQ